MEKKFTSDEVPLGQLLDQAASGDIQLPNFQRGWVWDDDHIVSLLASISQSFPIGAVMTLQTGNPDVRFQTRPLEGVELDAAVEPEHLLLDGQQRLTSLFLALRSPEPVPTRDSRGKDLKRHYFADIDACIDPEEDREDGAFVRVDETKRQMTNFGRDVVLDLSTRELEVQNEHFPLEIILDSRETTQWQFDYLQNGPGGVEAQASRLEKWQRFDEAFIAPFVVYQVPTIQLARSTPKEAVCNVFEKVNTGGVSLTVFELITATFAADGYNLREDWEARRAAFDDHPPLSRFEETDFLQVVTLLSTFEQRSQYLADNPEAEKPPAVSCKRKDVLKLRLEDYERWADPAQKAIEQAVPFLHREHIFKARDLPYATQIVPLAAILAMLGDRAGGHGTYLKLRQWFWCGVFGEMYGGSTETRFANDLQDVVSWIDADGPEPRTVKEAQFQADRLLTLRSRNSAAYKGMYALQMQRGGQDFRTGNRIDVHAYFDDNIDIHHIFPKKWCRDQRVDIGLGDSVVNKTAVDAHTNRRIGGRAPSEYLSLIEIGEGIESGELDSILRSHDIDPMALRQDDFEGFFRHRFERLVKQIEEAIGKPANRAADGTDNPYAAQTVDPERIRVEIQALVEAGESQTVEFKSTGRKNLHTENQDPSIEWSVVKTLAGFMNANGGTLLVGVADDGSVVGLEEDYPFVKGADADGWELWLTRLIETSLGMIQATEVDVQITALDRGTVARIDVGPSPQPVFATPLKGEKRKVFFARVNNSTEQMDGPDLLEYRQRRWPS